MNHLMLHEFHHGLNAALRIERRGVVNDYGDWLAEHVALRETAV